MPTPNSSATPYATAAAMKSRFDPRTLGDLCARSDSPGARLTPSQLDSDPVLAQALLDASGMVEAAVMVGGAHSPADLAALTGAGEAYLERLVCNLAIGLLFLGRPDRKGEPPLCYVSAEETLELIRRGERVFSLAEQQQAGGAALVTVERASTVEDRHGVRETAGRLFGRRNPRLHG